MKRIYLSPHLDDAVLSCGGAIRRCRAAGEPVLVVTVFAQDPPADRSLPPFALLQHEYWGNPPKPMALRRAEDVAALTLLDAGVQHLGYHDAVYRAGADGQWLYADLAALLGEVHPADPLRLENARELAEHLAELLPREAEQVVYAPLGVGRHVDHRLVHTAARRLGALGYRVAFYEDYPYAEQPGAIESALAAVKADGWTGEAVVLEATDVSAKVTALGYYASQLAVLFGGAERMPNRVWAFASSRPDGACLSERTWWPR